MRPFVALASLVAAATYASAQNYALGGNGNGNGVGQASPMPGGKPSHDPSSDFAERLADVIVGVDHPAPPPQPATLVRDEQAVFSRPGGGHVEIIGGRSLADTLTLDRRGRVWWDYAREIDSVTSRLLHIGQTTLLVPVDSAIMKLSRKPHQNAEGETTDDEAQSNVERFLAAHIIPDFNQQQTDKPVKTLLGKKVEIKGDEKRGAYFVNPGDYEVVEVSQATNGRILYINGVLPFRED